MLHELQYLASNISFGKKGYARPEFRHLHKEVEALEAKLELTGLYLQRRRYRYPFSSDAC